MTDEDRRSRRDCAHSCEAVLPMLDPVVERSLNLPRLQRLILKRARELAFALGAEQHLWDELDRLLGRYAERRERAYFELGTRSSRVALDDAPEADGDAARRDHRDGLASAR